MKKFERWAIYCFSSAFVVLLLMALFSLFNFDRHLTVQGPFKAEGGQPGSLAFRVDLRPALPIGGIFSSGGDSVYFPKDSTLRLSVNGVPLNYSHSLHQVVREKGGGAFSHWGNRLIFSLPQGVENSAATQLDIQFPLMLDRRLINLPMLLASIGGILLLYRLRVGPSGLYRKYMLRLLRGVEIASIGLLGLYMVAALAFLGTVLVGWWSGFALPNTALFHWWPQLNGLAAYEPSFGHALLLLAMLGGLVAWLVSWSAELSPTFAAFENRLVTWFNRVGVMAIMALFLYSVGASWAGLYRPADLAGNAIAGLLPFNDANGHFIGPYLQAVSGDWSPFTARRPLAMAFRTVVVAAVDYNNLHFLLLQVMALAIATFFAVRAVVAWRGIWAGLTFLGLVFILQRPYLPTNLTEPLGIFWALVSIPFLIRALRFGRSGDALTGFYLTISALMIRMGAMFTVPALGAWVVITRWRERRGVVKAVGWVSALLLINVVFVSGLSNLYGSPQGAVGSNFSYTICGLTHGTNWTGCRQIYADEFRQVTSEAEKAELLYAKAEEKFLSNPGTLFIRLLEGELEFLGYVWPQLLRVFPSYRPVAFPVALWWVVAIVGVTRVMRQQREKHEGSFWGLFLAGLASSAPFVIFDDGWRVMCASLVVLALFWASGFASPLHRPVDVGHSREVVQHRFRLALLFVIGVLFLVVPALVYQQDWLEQRRIPTLQLSANEVISLGSRRMAGFLVIPDGQVLPKHVPAMHESSFVEVIRNSGIEQYEPLVTPSPLHRPPFAIASVPIVKPSAGSMLLILPPEVFTQLDNRVWRLRLAVPQANYWKKVVEATALYRQ